MVSDIARRRIQPELGEKRKYKCISEACLTPTSIVCKSQLHFDKPLVVHRSSRRDDDQGYWTLCVLASIDEWCECDASTKTIVDSITCELFQLG